MIETFVSLNRSALMRIARLSILVSILSFLTTHALWAETMPLVIENEFTKALEIASFDIYEDPTATLDVTDIASEKLQASFSRAVPGQFNAGATDSNIWLRFRITNMTKEDTWYIAGRHPIMNVRFFRLHNDRSVEQEENLNTRMPLGKVNIPTGSTATFILLLNSKQIVDLQFDIMTMDQMLMNKGRESDFVAICAGIFLVMVLYNFLLYISIRDRIYLFYLGFVIVNMLLNLQAVNFPAGINSWLGIDWVEITNFYRPLAPLTFFIFAREFLKTRDFYPKWDMVLRIYMLVLVALMGLYFLVPRVQMFDICDLLFLPGILLLIASGYCAGRLGAKPSVYYILGCGSFLVGLLVYMASILDVLPVNDFTRNAHLIGQAIESTLMSLALAARIEKTQIEKTQADIRNKLKSEFLAQTNHDIRTPLSIIKGYAEMMLNMAEQNPELRIIRGAWISKMLRASNYIESILNDTSDILKIEAGKLEFECLAVPFNELMDEALMMMESKALKKGISLSLSVDKNIPDVINSDPKILQRILINLIDNAIKFTEKGEVKVLASLRTTVTGRGWIQIVVEDSGIGIKKGQEGQLFHPFSQLDRSIGKKYGGTGLGLYISKSLAQVLSGDVYYSAIQPEKGASFTISINLGMMKEMQRVINEDAPLQAPASESDSEDQRLLGMHILLADDDPLVLEMHAYLLKSQGAEVVEVTNGLEALQKAEASKFDVALMDIEMPVMGGLEAAERMRMQGISLPLIALTAKAMTGDEQSCLQAGFTDYLMKPVNFPKLLDKIASYRPRDYAGTRYNASGEAPNLRARQRD